jgi:predicted ABC-type transport system involved in lysophospholipase L1 biosynthesis ATPase subunit
MVTHNEGMAREAQRLLEVRNGRIVRDEYHATPSPA